MLTMTTPPMITADCEVLLMLLMNLLGRKMNDKIKSLLVYREYVQVNNVAGVAECC